MSIWSGLGKALKSLFKGGGAAAGGSAAAGAVANGGKIILTWGNTFKVAVVGAFSYLFLTGGASNVVSTALGIPEGVAQVLIILLFVVFLFFAVRYLVNYARDHIGLKKEYLEEPIFQRNIRSDLRPGDIPENGNPYCNDRSYDIRNHADRSRIDNVHRNDRWPDMNDHWNGGDRR